MQFRDREHAGKLLAERLVKYKAANAVIYALPRGGVPVAYEIKKALGIPMSLIITRKIGHPSSREYAICATAEDGHTICNEYERSKVNEKWFSEAVNAEMFEIRRRKEKYLKGNVISARGKIAIIVDDGVATGFTIRLAIKEIRHDSPVKIIVAVPVCPADMLSHLRKEADEIIVLKADEDYLGAVGSYYKSFPQVEDSEVINTLKK